MTSKEPSNLAGAVRDWFSKQGLPLEMAVASHLSTLQYSVVQSASYADSSTGKGREIDLVASRNYKSGARFSLVVECKVSKEKPWVLLETMPTSAASRLDAGDDRNVA